MPSEFARKFFIGGVVFCALAVAGAEAQSQRPVPLERRVTRSPHGNLKLACENCHTFTSWKPIRSIPEFDHSQTRFPLRGLHVNVSCKQCHNSLVFTNVSSKCADCHADIHRRQMGANCEQCHTVKGWRVSLQQVSQHQDRFPLLGAHAVVDCEACHTSAAVGQFKGLSTECLSCHTAAFQRATMPDHKAAQLPTTCQTCHTMDGWFGARFDHAQFAGFALSGAHARLDCSACHVGGRYQGTSANCFSCHANDFRNTTNPNHVTAGFPQDCSRCHTTATWLGSKFDHNTMTKFPLTGSHVNLACSSCHANGQYAGTPANCASCHLADFQKTTNPNHVAAGFPQDCSRCHTTSTWLGAKFDHNSMTKFPLTGSHVNLACSSCHANGQYAGTPANCASCHLADFQKTTNPNHVAAGFPQDCSRCHTTSTWLGAKFDHNTLTKFPLTGAHINAACSACHVNGRFAGTPKTCDACHLPDFQKTTNPNHVAAGFPTDCSICHTTAQWLGAKFDHSKTAFPLTGAHVNQTCSTCHVGGKYVGLDPSCVACHLTNYNGTTNPNHKAAGFPTTCSVCHSTIAWMPASFDHSQTRFPLTGKHTSTPCASCHVGGVYAGTPTDCYSCHKKEFISVTNPNHVAAGFPTTCAQCHTTSSWLGATFNHSWFPIYSGAHAGKWTTCNDCHVNPSNFQVFSCLTCHAHDKTLMDQKHQGVRNYVYNSANCYSCHPTGKGG